MSDTARTPVFVLFGATGDLAERMLFPSLYFLHVEGHLPADQRILGSARSSYSDAEFREEVAGWVRDRVGDDVDEEQLEKFLAKIAYASIDVTRQQDFDKLRDALSGGEDEAVFYLSTSPKIFGAVCKGLRESGLSEAPNRIVAEKPIGHDLQSNVAINDALAHSFSEDRTFRIDHYLGKETVQNLIALRFGNAIFEPLWNANAIDYVQITIAEPMGIEGRGEYYDAYGAIRDMVQNHLLQLLTLLAMEPPSSLAPDSVRHEKLKVLNSLAPITPANVEEKTVRGQYREGFDAQGEPAADYLTDAGVNESETETFVAIEAEIRNWRWTGVPFYLETGKRMAEKRTQIVISFKPVPHSIFKGKVSCNELVITLQPKEEITLRIMNKKPGLIPDRMALQELDLNLLLADHLDSRRRIAYEQLILDALNDNAGLFVQRDEQEAAWRWIDGIAHSWDERGLTPRPYRAGTNGPAQKHALTERKGHSWYE